MDKEFQTSFVPKKTIMEREPRHIGGGLGSAVNLIALVIFIASILGAGGTYFYRSSLQSTVDGYKDSLTRARAAFEPALITKLQVLDKRMRAAGDILGAHVAVSPIFSLIGDVTLPTVRYSDFSYAFDKTNTDLVNIKMSGQAKGYNYIALQADLFAQNKFIKNPIFSNFTLDQLGNVDFNLTFSVDKSLVIYESFLERQTSLGAPGSSTATSTNATSTNTSITPTTSGVYIPPVNSGTNNAPSSPPISNMGSTPKTN